MPWPARVVFGLAFIALGIWCLSHLASSVSRWGAIREDRRAGLRVERRLVQGLGVLMVLVGIAFLL